MIAVAALDTSSNKAWFSNWGSWVDVAAPGLSISTTTTGAGYTTGFAGTSGACPHVAGLAALLCSALPTATPAQIRDALENGAVPLIQAPFGEYTGYGRIDCAASLVCAGSPSCSTGPARALFLAPCGGGPLEVPTTSGAAKLPPHIVYGTHFDLASNARLLYPSLGDVTAVRRTRNELEVVGMSNHLPYYYVELVVRKVLVPDIDAMEIVIRRAYSNVSGAETIELYDWSTASFPYGSFVNVSSAPAPSGAPQTAVIPLPATPARFVDDEGTMYVRINVNGAASNGALTADLFHVVVY